MVERTCYYQDGVLTFTVEDLYMLVTVENDETGDTYVETITPDYPYMEIGTEPGCYTITCLTDQNQTFIGYLEI